MNRTLHIRLLRLHPARGKGEKDSLLSEMVDALAGLHDFVYVVHSEVIEELRGVRQVNEMSEVTDTEELMY